MSIIIVAVAFISSIIIMANLFQAKQFASKAVMNGLLLMMAISIILLGALFLVDATATLLWRWRRKENITEAHASHFYQRMARRLGSHTRITILYSAINIFWLLPMYISSQ